MTKPKPRRSQISRVIVITWVCVYRDVDCGDINRASEWVVQHSVLPLHTSNVKRSFPVPTMLDTSIHMVHGTGTPGPLEMDISEYPGISDPAKSSFMEASSARKRRELSSATEDCKSPLAGSEISQDLFSLIDSFNVEAPIEHFDHGNTEAFQFVIDDVIDAAPSGDEFDFLDNICGFSSCDIPVKNSSSMTDTACVYTFAAEKDRYVNQVTCAMTASSTCVTSKSEAFEMLTPADQELLDKLPGFLENIDSVVTVNIRAQSAKRELEDSSANQPCKKFRPETYKEVTEKDKDSNLSRDNICARGS